MTRLLLNHSTKLSSALLVILCSMLCSFSAMAGTTSYDFSRSIPSGWTSSETPNGYEINDPARGTQFTKNATLTLKGVKNATKVVITCSSNLAGKNTIELSVGGKSWGKETLAKENNVEKTFTGTGSGDLVITITRADKSVYIKKIEITADEAGSGNEDDNGGEGTSLDPNYKYTEPTVVKPINEESSNMPYTFVQNNIEVRASVGALRPDYFGCNAGGEITFTATKEIKGLVINGYIKKDFDAKASCGEIYYMDASEDDVESDPVLAILDVNSKSVTITCTKQLRCYEVYFYFNENPELDIEGGDDDGELNYDWEPTTAKNLNIKFDELYYYDFSEFYGYNCTSLYLSSDDFEASLDIYATASGVTGLAEGVYQINDSEEDGTVQASPGGDDYDDYPSFITTDFEYDEEYEQYYYNTVYYLISGTLTVEKTATGAKYTINATTYNGSKINAVFEGKPVNGLGDDDAIATVNDSKTASTSKLLKNGRIVIRNNEKTYDTTGRRVK